MLVIVAPGQGAQTPGFLTPWLEDPSFAERLARALGRRRARPGALRHRGRRRHDPADRDRPAVAGRHGPGHRPLAVPGPGRPPRRSRRRRRAQRRRAHRGRAGPGDHGRGGDGPGPRARHGDGRRGGADAHGDDRRPRRRPRRGARRDREARPHARQRQRSRADRRRRHHRAARRLRRGPARQGTVDAVERGRRLPHRAHAAGRRPARGPGRDRHDPGPADRGDLQPRRQCGRGRPGGASTGSSVRSPTRCAGTCAWGR